MEQFLAFQRVNCLNFRCYDNLTNVLFLAERRCAVCKRISRFALPPCAFYYGSLFSAEDLFVRLASKTGNRERLSVPFNSATAKKLFTLEHI